MTDCQDDQREMKNLQFFGKINASISHELKNILAIISETTGFVDDLTQLARQGKKFDLSLLENCNQSVVEEIERGFHTIRQMNKLAHTTDMPVASADITEHLDLAVKLTKFLSFSKPVKMVSPEKSVQVETRPFLLVTTFYQLLCELFKATAGDHPLGVKIIAGNNQDATIIFSEYSFDFLPALVSEVLDDAAHLLNFKWETDKSENTITLHLLPAVNE
jgi:signal transduction histidine kinase